MKNKKIRSIIAKTFRQNLKIEFSHSVSMAKIFLTGSEWESTVKNSNMGFCYDWQFEEDMTESLVFTGYICYGEKVYSIPLELYEIRETYKKNIK